MRIYEVTFDGRIKGDLEWSPNWQKVNVAVENGGALEAVELATTKVMLGKSAEVRPAEMKVLAETS